MLVLIVMNQGVGKKEEERKILLELGEAQQGQGLK
jgi:hypothetical protein